MFSLAEPAALLLDSDWQPNDTCNPLFDFDWQFDTALSLIGGDWQLDVALKVIGRD